MIKITHDQNTGLKLSYPEGAVLVPRGVTVSDPSGPGVSVDSAVLGHVSNRGWIIGAIDGVNMYSGLVANKGTISAGHDGSGVYFGQDPYWPDGTLTNATLINRGVIQNGLYGFQFSGDSVVANIVNSGSISTRPLDPPHFRNWPPTDIEVTASNSAQVTVNNSGSMTGYDGIVITGAALNPRPYQPAVLDLSLRNSGSIVTDAATVHLSGDSVSLSLTNSGMMHSGEEVVDASAYQTLSATITNRGDLSGALKLSSSGSLSASVHNDGVMGSMFLSGMRGDADIANHGLMTDIRFAVSAPPLPILARSVASCRWITAPRWLRKAGWATWSMTARSPLPMTSLHWTACPAPACCSLDPMQPWMRAASAAPASTSWPAHMKS
jgi:hypothetical protein